jgi:hypothetical protein
MTDLTWTRIRIAEHEATHAIAAMKMGLPVCWVDINQGTAEGIDYMAAVQIPDEHIDRDRDLFAICVAMAAPSFLTMHREHEIGRYAQVEAQLAYEMGGRAGITQDAIWDEASDIVRDEWNEILDLSERLVDEGRVDFAVTA